MKKLLIAATMLAVTTAATAGWWNDLFGNKVTIVGAGSPKSASNSLAQALATNISADTRFEKDCGLSIRTAESQSRSMYLTTNHQIAKAAARGIDCSAGLKSGDHKVVAMAEVNFQVCRLPETTATLMTPGVTVGRASVHPIAAFVEDFNRNNGASIKGVPFKGSANVLKGVLAGDVDWGVMGTNIVAPAMEKGLVVCDYDTSGAGSSTGKSLNDAFKLDLNGWRLINTFVTPNINDPSDIQSVFGSAEFVKFLESKNYYNITANPSADQVADVLADAEAIQNYGK